MPAGKFDRRAAFRRRLPADAAVTGNAFGEWEATPFLDVPAQFEQKSGKTLTEGGGAVDVGYATLVIRDSAAARAVSIAHRVTVRGFGREADFAIETVDLPDRKSGSITMIVSSKAGGA